MTDGDAFSYQDLKLSLSQSMFFDKEDMIQGFLENVLKLHDLTREEFERDWIIEEFPIDIHREAAFHKTENPDTYNLYVKQLFTFRKKTDEERQLELEENNKEKKDVDPHNV